MMPQLSALFHWQHDVTSSHQWWRIFTGSFTHINAYHLGMNVIGYWLLAYLFRTPTKGFILHTAVLALCVGIGLMFTSTQNYYGLSGVLHGLFAVYVLKEILAGRLSSWLLLMGLIAKLIAENNHMMPISSAALIGARVSTESHLIGSVCGLALPLIALGWRRLR